MEQKSLEQVPRATRRQLPVLATTAPSFRFRSANSLGTATSTTAILHVMGGTDVLTYHNNNFRTGVNANEVTLTTSNVSASGFGKVGFFPTDGQVNAQPLYVSQLDIPVCCTERWPS